MVVLRLNNHVHAIRATPPCHHTILVGAESRVKSAADSDRRTRTVGCETRATPYVGQGTSDHLGGGPRRRHDQCLTAAHGCGPEGNTTRRTTLRTRPGWFSSRSARPAPTPRRSSRESRSNDAPGRWELPTLQWGDDSWHFASPFHSTFATCGLSGENVPCRLVLWNSPAGCVNITQTQEALSRGAEVKLSNNVRFEDRDHVPRSTTFNKVLLALERGQNAEADT